LLCHVALSVGHIMFYYQLVMSCCTLSWSYHFTLSIGNFMCCNVTWSCWANLWS